MTSPLFPCLGRRLAALLLLAGLQAPASALPPIFYRVVKADPDTVFPAGFQPWGRNRNLLTHVQGTTCRRVNTAEEANERSAYTSVSGTLAAALRTARVKLQQNRAGPATARVWIYQIRPTPDFYNVGLTFERAGQPLHAGPLRFPYQNALLLDEWVTPLAVPATLVREAHQYRLDGDTVAEVPEAALSNARYVLADTQANPAPLPATVITGATAMQAVAARTRAVIGTVGNTLSACWCGVPVHPAPQPDSPARAAPATESADPADPCLDQVYFLNDPVPDMRYIPSGNWLLEL